MRPTEYRFLPLDIIALIKIKPEVALMLIIDISKINNDGDLTHEEEEELFAAARKYMINITGHAAPEYNEGDLN